jgi:hypothetical protein
MNLKLLINYLRLLILVILYKKKKKKRIKNKIITHKVKI